MTPLPLAGVPSHGGGGSEQGPDGAGAAEGVRSGVRGPLHPLPTRTRQASAAWMVHVRALPHA